MQESFSVTQDLSYLEYVGLSLYMLPKNKLFKRLLIYVSCIGILGAVLSILGAGGKEVVSVTSVFLQLIGPPITIIIIFIVFALLFGLFIMTFKREVLKGVTFNFTHWGLERIAAKSTASVPWKDFQDAKETKNFILLFVKEKNTNNIYAIKKASLVSPVFEDELIKFIDKNRPL
jgi:YcxB-like protein